MHRREMLRMFSTMAMTPVLSPDIFALLRQAQPSSNYSLRTLKEPQNETVVAMMDLIIPVTDTAGAKAARVNEFIDVILTDWAIPEERDDFLAGLATIDTLSNTLFAKKFVAASVEQQTALLRSLDDEIDWQHESARRPRSVPPSGRDGQLRGEFFRVFKRLTLHGYYTSEIGFTQELKLEIIPGAQHGCIPAPAGKKA